jgi:hypothetical protein
LAVSAEAASVHGGGSGGSGMVAGDIDSSAELAAIVGDETGSGALVFGTAPTISSAVLTTKVNLPRVTALPGTPSAGDTVIVTDDSAAGACDSAAGAATTICQYNGSAWVAIGDGGGAGSSSDGSAEAVQASDGAGGFTDSGCTAASGSLTCPNGLAAGDGATVGAVELLEGTCAAGSGANKHKLCFDGTSSLLVSQENGGSAVTYHSTAYPVTDIRWYEAAGCNNATAGPVWDLPTSNAAAAACVTGTNTQQATLDFDASTDESAQFKIKLPSGWTGAIDVTFRWFAAATTGSVGWCAQLVRVPDAATGDPAFPAQAAGNCVSDAVKGTTLQQNDAAKTGVTCTSCAAGDLVYVRISRDADGGAVTDDMAGDARLIGVEITTRRTM